MSEIQLHRLPTRRPGPQETDFEYLPSDSIVGYYEAQGIGVEDREGVAQSLDRLRSEFGIEDSAFERPRNKLMLVAIADRLNTLEHSEGTGDQGSAERKYITDLVMDTVGPLTRFKDQFHELVSDGEKVSDEAKKAAFDRYTQPELTADLIKLIKGPAFDELRTRLGVDEEDPYEVRVLSIDDEHASRSYGLDPGVDWDSDEDFDSITNERSFRERYKQGLVANGRALREALGKTHDFMPAWVTTFEDGSSYLCIMSSTAEKVLYKDEKRASYYDEDAYEDDLSIIMHEYAHTQKGLFEGTYIGTGIALEELRAEHFSGDQHGYTDIKKFYMGIQMLTGYSPKSGFEQEGRGYDEAAFMEDIARNLGLKGYLDCMVTIPENYAESPDANPYTKSIVAHNGGNLSGHFARIVQRLKAERGSEAVEASLSAGVDRVREMARGFDTVTVESWFAHGGLASLRDLAIENFRRRYPDESDGYDYSPK